MAIFSLSTFKINSLPDFNFECTGTQKDIKNKLDSICKILNQKNDEELQIYGELMLVAEKVQAGNFNDKIHETNPIIAGTMVNRFIFP